MLRMEYEKEVILSIRHRIETYEQQQLFDDNIIDEDYTPGLDAMFENSHIHLGSRQRSLKLLSYEKVLEESQGFDGFSDSLAEFLRDYAHAEVYGSDFVGDGFEGHPNCIYWCKVIHVRLLTSSSSNPLVIGVPTPLMQSLVRLPRNSCSENRDLPRFIKLAWIRAAI